MTRPNPSVPPIGLFTKPRKLPAFSRMPVAIFPVLFGAMGVVLGWRKAGDLSDSGALTALADAVSGATILLFGFALVGYAVKLIRRPSVVLDELTILPGRTGLAAMVLGVYLAGMIFSRISTTATTACLILGLILHALLIGLLIRQFVFGAREQARVTPAWQLSFTGPIVGALLAMELGMRDLALPLFWASFASAVILWLISADQFRRASVPAPLRPLLVIHLSPAALLGMVALALGYTGLATGFTALSMGFVAMFGVGGRWLTQAGFSAFWSAFTFPLAGTASLWLAMGAAQPAAWGEVLIAAGGLLLVAATLITAPILVRLLKMWAKGDLAVKSNAATA
ncbi:tellurium resistance protein [Albirhodobacter sp. R86504]|uniref:SLAC1 family transporter n=1 Tax=Albirhodobacter sp. R86504 TaxID=3093848 RepID=UPI0036718F89